MPLSISILLGVFVKLYEAKIIKGAFSSTVVSRYFPIWGRDYFIGIFIIVKSDEDKVYFWRGYF